MQPVSWLFLSRSFCRLARLANVASMVPVCILSLIKISHLHRRAATIPLSVASKPSSRNKASIALPGGVPPVGGRVPRTSRMRSISSSPSSHGCDGTDQLSDSFAASTAAASVFRESDVVPSKAMKSTMWPAMPVWGLSFSFTVPGSHEIRSMVADAPAASVNVAGFRTPLVSSAATVVPSVTGSKNASCRVPSGAVTVTVQSWR